MRRTLSIPLATIGVLSRDGLLSFPVGPGKVVSGDNPLSGTLDSAGGESGADGLPSPSGVLLSILPGRNESLQADTHMTSVAASMAILSIPRGHATRIPVNMTSQSRNIWHTTSGLTSENRFGCRCSIQFRQIRNSGRCPCEYKTIFSFSCSDYKQIRIRVVRPVVESRHRARPAPWRHSALASPASRTAPTVWKAWTCSGGSGGRGLQKRPEGL